MLSEKKIRRIIRQVVSESSEEYESSEENVTQLHYGFERLSLDDVYRIIDPADTDIEVRFSDGEHLYFVQGVFLLEKKGKRYIVLSQL
jgi:hypothetical protein